MWWLLFPRYGYISILWSNAGHRLIDLNYSTLHLEPLLLGAIDWETREEYPWLCLHNAFNLTRTDAFHHASCAGIQRQGIQEALLIHSCPCYISRFVSTSFVLREHLLRPWLALANKIIPATLRNKFHVRVQIQPPRNMQKPQRSIKCSLCDTNNKKANELIFRPTLHQMHTSRGMITELSIAIFWLTSSASTKNSVI